mmetsp:Transcript_13776/g.51397  ORF Transcript_13776/g.51397 Transcript_13776/m.51397 type:complete len:666 (-) Transcript_13776:132-2129(-)
MENSWGGDDVEYDFSSNGSKKKLPKSLSSTLNDVKTPKTSKKKSKFGLQRGSFDPKINLATGKKRKGGKKRKRVREDPKSYDQLDLRSVAPSPRDDPARQKRLQKAQKQEKPRQPLQDAVLTNGAPAEAQGSRNDEEEEHVVRDRPRSTGTMSFAGQSLKKRPAVKGKPLAPPGSSLGRHRPFVRQPRPSPIKRGAYRPSKRDTEAKAPPRKTAAPRARAKQKGQMDSLALLDRNPDDSPGDEARLDNAESQKPVGGTEVDSQETVTNDELSQSEAKATEEPIDSRPDRKKETPKKSPGKRRQRRKSGKSRRSGGIDNPIALSSDSEGESDEQTYQRMLKSPSGKSPDDDAAELFRFPFEKDCVDAIHITNSDLNRLEDMEYLNDKNVDLYIKWLSQLSPELESGRPLIQSRCAIFSSLFFTRLVESVTQDADDDWSKRGGRRSSPRKNPAKRNYKDISRWTKNLDIFEKDFLFIPIVQDLHWSLAVVCHPAKLPGLPTARTDGAKPSDDGVICMLMLDSLNLHSAQKFQRIIVEWLAYEARAKRGRGGPLPVKTIPVVRPNLPKQKNTWDCGIYTCEYARFVLSRLDGLVIDSDDVKKRAKRVFSSCEFTAEDAVQKRGEMKELYRTLRGAYRAELKRRVEESRGAKAESGGDDDGSTEEETEQ